MTSLCLSLLPGSTAPVASRRPNPAFGDIRIIQNDEIANYKGLSVTLRQRLSHGLSLQASYTWSHTLDVGTDSNGGGARRWIPITGAPITATPNWDVRHRFIEYFNYALPFFNSGSNAFIRQVLG